MVHLFGCCLTVVALACAAAAGALAGSFNRPPLAAGVSSANIPLSGANVAVLNRWVARASGVISNLYLRDRTAGATACADDPGTGYGAGNGGTWLVSTYAVLRSGLPDFRRQLSQNEFSACQNGIAESERIPLNMRVVKGRMYATIVRNVGPDPAHNYSSQNFLYAGGGLLGANGRNDLNPNAPNSYYGLDPRELVGYSSDGGRTWSLPGGPYGPRGGRAFVPTFLEQFANGLVAGQPYYSAHLMTGQLTTIYRVASGTTFRAIGATTSGPGSGRVSVLVNGHAVRSATLSGEGAVSAAIRPLRIRKGQTVSLQVTAGPGGLDVYAVYAGDAWAQLMHLGLGYRWYLQQMPQYALPLYPLTRRPT